MVQNLQIEIVYELDQLHLILHTEVKIDVRFASITNDEF